MTKISYHRLYAYYMRYNEFKQGGFRVDLVNRDEEHLRLLQMGHMIFGGIQALFSLFPIFHFLIGLMILLNPKGMCGPNGNCFPEMLGVLFTLFAGLFIFFGLLFAGLMFLNGYYLGKRKHYLTCQIISILECFFFPYCTILGVLTYIVLSRPSVKALFEQVETGTPLSS